jgi:hypothetical protein
LEKFRSGGPRSGIAPVACHGTISQVCGCPDPNGEMG